MQNFAELQVIGHIGRSELTYSQNGGARLNFSIARNRFWRDSKTKDPREATEWFDFVVWGNRAEALAESVKSGRFLRVTGDPRFREFTRQDGVKCRTLEFQLDDLKYLDGRQTVTEAPQKVQSAPAPDEEIPF